MPVFAFTVICGQVRRDLYPGVTPVFAFMYKLAAEIDGVIVKGILCQG